MPKETLSLRKTKRNEKGFLMKAKSYLKQTHIPDKRLGQKEIQEMNKNMNACLNKYNQKTGSWKDRRKS